MPALVVYDTPDEYRQHYLRHYCRSKIITFDNIRVYFKPLRWGHVFYDSALRDGKKDEFSTMRAQRINWIKATLENADAELYQGWNNVTKTYDNNNQWRVSVVYEDFVVVILINQLASNRKPYKADL